MSKVTNSVHVTQSVPNSKRGPKCPVCPKGPRHPHWVTHNDKTYQVQMTRRLISTLSLTQTKLNWAETQLKSNLSSKWFDFQSLNQTNLGLAETPQNSNILFIQATTKVKLPLTCAPLSKVLKVTKSVQTDHIYNVSVMTRSPNDSNVQKTKNFQKWPKGTKMTAMFKRPKCPQWLIHNIYYVRFQP